MIPIKIKNKSYKIKAISELNTAEFIELSNIDKCDMIKYIAWQTKAPIKDAWFAVTSKAVETAIGTMPDISKLPKSKKFDYGKTIETVGQRHQVEACGLSNYELLVFVLAVAMAKSNNIDDVYKLRDSYLQQPFSEILPAGFFFFKILRDGRSSGLSNLKRLLLSIVIPKLRRPRALIA